IAKSISYKKHTFTYLHPYLLTYAQRCSSCPAALFTPKTRRSPVPPAKQNPACKYVGTYISTPVRVYLRHVLDTYSCTHLRTPQPSQEGRGEEGLFAAKLWVSRTTTRIPLSVTDSHQLQPAALNFSRDLPDLPHLNGSLAGAETYSCRLKKYMPTKPTIKSSI